MKMCDVVKDLYGVYCDGFASGESKKLIKKHLFFLFVGKSGFVMTNNTRNF